MSEQNLGIKINISKVGSGATQAKSEIDSLLSSVNSLKDALDQASADRPKPNMGIREALAETKEESEEARQKLDELSESERKAGEAGKEGANGIKDGTEEIDKIPKVVPKATGMLANLASSFRRILKLRIMRGIIRSVFSAFKEGTQNIYAYSQALNSADSNHFASTMDGLASALLKLKNTIGTAVAPLLTAIIPVLKTIVGWITAAIDAIAQFLAVLQGKSTYTRAKDVSVQWQDTASALGDANANAQKLKRTLLGFDEINALDAPDTGSGGGGGGGGDSVSPSLMFEEAPVDVEGVTGFINAIATALHPVYEAIQGLPTIADAAITMLSGVFENSPEKLKEGLNKLQKLFTENKTWNAVINWVHGAITDMETWIKNALRDIEKWIYQAAIDVLTFLKPVFKLFGIDVDPLITTLEKGIEKVNKKIEKNTELAEESKRVWKEWSNSEISTDAFTILSGVIIGTFGGGKKQVRSFEATIKSLEQHGYDPTKLLTGMNKGRTAGEKAQIVMANFRSAIQKLSNDPTSFSTLKKEFEALGIKVNDTKKKTDDSKTSVENMGKLNISFDALKTQFFNLKTASENAKTGVDSTKGALEDVNKAKVDQNDNTTQLNNLASAGKDASGKVTDTKTALGDLKKKSINESDNSSQLQNLGDQAYYAKGGIVSVNSVIKTLNKKKINTSMVVGALENIRQKGYDTATWLTTIRDLLVELATSKSIYTAFKLIGVVNQGVITQKKDGGFVNGYAKGGIIPRFDGGGINSANLFLAHENGIPELVGRIGNSTAVANQGQMVSAMAQGVYEAMMEVMSASSGQNEVNVYIDGERIARAVDRANRIANRRFNVGLV